MLFFYSDILLLFVYFCTLSPNKNVARVVTFARATVHQEMGLRSVLRLKLQRYCKERQLHTLSCNAALQQSDTVSLFELYTAALF